MTIQFFSPRGPGNEILKLPRAYRRSVKWLPQIGDIVPDFTVATTQGELGFWEWASGSWVHLFSHPAAFTPVCTTEVASLASYDAAWDANNVKVLGLTGSTVPELKAWHQEIEEFFDTRVTFPTAHDPGLQLSRLFGMMHEKESQDWAIRKSFVIDPALRLQMIFEYPIFVGRNTEEILRVIQALQLRAKTGAATPSDWYSGDVAIIPDDVSEEEVWAHFGTTSTRLRKYLRVALPRARGQNPLSPVRYALDAPDQPPPCG